MATHEILHLRSPAVHHPDPNPHALRSFAESRSQQLFPPYDLSGTQLFQDFCMGCHSLLEVAEAGDCCTGTEDRTVLSPVFAEVWKDIVIVSRCS